MTGPVADVKDALRSVNHLQYNDVQPTAVGVRVTPQDGNSYVNNAEFRAFREAGFVTDHVELGDNNVEQGVYLRRASESAEKMRFTKTAIQTAVAAEREGEPAATIRYKPDWTIEEGSTFEMLAAADHQRFGTAAVDHVEEVQVAGSADARSALDVVKDYGAHHQCKTEADLVAVLNDHYDDTIWPTTHVVAIIYTPELEEGGHAP